jgi:hypothetical protein
MVDLKIFRGMPGGQVTVEDGGKVSVLPPVDPARVDFTWGNGGAGASHLSLALAESVLGDHREAVRFYQRLKHRTVMSWTANSQWTITEKDLLSHIEDMRQNERESAQAKAMVSQQPAPVVYEGGTGIGGIPIKRSDKDQGPGPVVAQERRQEPANAFAVMTAGLEHVVPDAHQRPSTGLGEAVPDDWPEKVDGFRAMAGDFVTGTRLVYCLVLCGCYSWQDAAQVPEERLRTIPQWGDALMAEMMEVFAKRNITYVVKERRQVLLASALSKLTPEEKEAMGLS